MGKRNTPKDNNKYRTLVTKERGRRASQEVRETRLSRIRRTRTLERKKMGEWEIKRKTVNKR